jgi:SAM-dependent methyltransferase
MSWRKFLLVPRLAAVGLRPSPPPEVAWESYWRDVAETGPTGDVLWDGAGDAELAWWRTSARQHLDPSLAVVDVGCGNGRLARLLAEDFETVVGVDVSVAAVERARRESLGHPGLVFRVLDITADGAADALTDELGSVNVVVRGVLHVLDGESRRRAASALASLVGGLGTLLLLETNWRGSLLGYLEHLGGSRGSLPDALGRLIDYRVPRPSSFGPGELAETFPEPAWTVVESGPVDIAPVRSLGPASGRTIPGFHAVLRSLESPSDVPGPEGPGGVQGSG